MSGGQVPLPLLLALSFPCALHALRGQGAHLRSLTALQESDGVPARVCSEDEDRMRKLQQVFNERYASRVSEAFAAMETSAILTICGNRQRALANYLLHLQEVAVAVSKRFTVANAALDPDTLKTCEILRVNLAESLDIVCIDLADWFEHNKEEVKRRFIFYWSKPIIFRAAVEASRHGVLMTDLDLAVHQDLLGHVESVFDEDQRLLAVTAVDVTPWWYNTGAIFATRRGAPLLDLWVEENNCYWEAPAGDQSALNGVIQRNLTQIGATRHQIHKMSGDLVGQLCAKGSIATHFNCIEKSVKKLERLMQEHGEWLDVDAALTDGRLLGGALARG